MQAGGGDGVTQPDIVGLRAQIGDRRPDRRFGRAVHVQDARRSVPSQIGQQALAQGLSAQGDGLQPRHRGTRRCVLQQQARHRRGGLQVRDLVPRDLGRDAVIGDLGRDRVHAVVQHRQMPQAVQHHRRGDAIVDQAGDLGHADLAQGCDPRLGIVHSPEQAAVIEIAQEGEIEDALHLVRVQVRQVQRHRVGDARGLLEGREGPGILLDQRGGGAKVFLHRLARGLHRGLARVGQITVQHQRDGEIRRIVTRLTQGCVIFRDAGGDVVHALAQKMGQHVRAKPPGLAPGLGVARGGQPDGQFRRYRSGLGHDGKGGAVGARKLDRLAAPQPADLVDGLQHRRFIRGRRVLRAQHEIVRLPAGGHGDAAAPIGQVVDDRPFLGDAGRVVEGADARPCADRDVLRDRRHRRPGDRGVRIGAAEGVEVPLGRPDGDEAVAVGEFRALQQQFVFLGARPVVIAPVVQRHLHALAAAGGRLRRGTPQKIACDDDLPATGQRPEDLQHGNVEGQAGDRQPGARFGGIQRPVHAGEEVHHVAVFDHHPLGRPGRAGGIDQIGQVLARCGPGVRLRSVGVHRQHARLMRWQARQDRRVGQDHRRTAVGDVMLQPVGRIVRVQRHIGAARLQDRQRTDDQSQPARGEQAHGHAGADAHRGQLSRQMGRALVQLGIAQPLSAKDQRVRIGASGDLCGERVLDRRRRVRARIAVVAGHGRRGMGRQSRGLVQRQGRIGRGQGLGHVGDGAPCGLRQARAVPPDLHARLLALLKRHADRGAGRRVLRSRGQDQAGCPRTPQFRRAGDQVGQHRRPVQQRAAIAVKDCGQRLQRLAIGIDGQRAEPQHVVAHGVRQMRRKPDVEGRRSRHPDQRAHQRGQNRRGGKRAGQRQAVGLPIRRRIRQRGFGNDHGGKTRHALAPERLVPGGVADGRIQGRIGGAGR